MSKLKYIVLILIVFTFFDVKAATCTSDELAKLKELANNIEIKKQVQIRKDNPPIEDGVYYTIDISNYNHDLLIRYKTYGVMHELDTSDYSDLLFSEGQKVTFYIYAFTLNTCSGNLLRTIDYKFDIYNMYYYNNKEKCDANPEFKYCDEYLDTSKMNTEDIDKKFDEYLAKNNNNSSNIKIDSNNLIYYIIGSVVLVIVIGVVIVVIIRKKKKNSF